MTLFAMDTVYGHEAAEASRAAWTRASAAPTNGRNLPDYILLMVLRISTTWYGDQVETFQ